MNLKMSTNIHPLNALCLPKTTTKILTTHWHLLHRNWEIFLLWVFLFVSLLSFSFLSPFLCATSAKFKLCALQNVAGHSHQTLFSLLIFHHSHLLNAMFAWIQIFLVLYFKSYFTYGMAARMRYVGWIRGHIPFDLSTSVAVQLQVISSYYRKTVKKNKKFCLHTQCLF